MIATSSNKNSSAASELLCLFCTPQRLEKSSSLLYGPNRHLSKKQQGSWENPECMRTKNTAESPYRKQLDKDLFLCNTFQQHGVSAAPLKNYWDTIKLFECVHSGALRGCGKGIHVLCVFLSLSISTISLIQPNLISKPSHKLLCS